MDMPFVDLYKGFGGGTKNYKHIKMKENLIPILNQQTCPPQIILSPALDFPVNKFLSILLKVSVVASGKNHHYTPRRPTT